MTGGRKTLTTMVRSNRIRFDDQPKANESRRSVDGMQSSNRDEYHCMVVEMEKNTRENNSWNRNKTYSTKHNDEAEDDDVKTSTTATTQTTATTTMTTLGATQYSIAVDHLHQQQNKQQQEAREHDLLLLSSQSVGGGGGGGGEGVFRPRHTVSGPPDSSCPCSPPPISRCSSPISSSWQPPEDIFLPMLNLDDDDNSVGVGGDGTTERERPFIHPRSSSPSSSSRCCRSRYVPLGIEAMYDDDDDDDGDDEGVSSRCKGKGSFPLYQENRVDDDFEVGAIMFVEHRDNPLP